LKYFRYLLKATCPDPVGAFFVFLNLLEREAQRFAEFFLAHTEHDAAHTHTAADISVNRVGRFSRHFQHSLGLRALVVRQNESVVCPGRQYRQILLGELVNADNFSYLTVWINPRRRDNANCPADLSTSGFTHAVFWPSSQFKHQSCERQKVHFVTRRRMMKIRAAATTKAAGISPVRA
jgi:hypothetical protein